MAEAQEGPPPHHTCRDPSTPGPPTFTRSPHLSLLPGRSSGGSSAGDKGRPAVQTVGGSYQHIYLIEIRAPLIRINGPPVLQLLEIWNLKRRTKSATLMSGLFSPSLPRSENIVLIGTQRKNWFPSLTEWKPLFCKEKKTFKKIVWSHSGQSTKAQIIAFYFVMQQTDKVACRFSFFCQWVFLAEKENWKFIWCFLNLK